MPPTLRARNQSGPSASAVITGAPMPPTLRARNQSGPSASAVITGAPMPPTLRARNQSGPSASAVITGAPMPRSLPPRRGRPTRRGARVGLCSPSMRAWKAVLLVNALLVLLGAGGFVAWRRAQEATAGAAGTVAWGGPEREWHGIQGVVRAVMPELGIIVLTHEDIPGYMPGMTMGFRV